MVWSIMTNRKLLKCVNELGELLVWPRCGKYSRALLCCSFITRLENFIALCPAQRNHELPCHIVCSLYEPPSMPNLKLNIKCDRLGK